MEMYELELKMRALESALSKKIKGHVSAEYCLNQVMIRAICKDRGLGSDINVLDFMYNSIDALVDKILSDYKSIVLSEYFKED